MHQRKNFAITHQYDHGTQEFSCRDLLTVLRPQADTFIDAVAWGNRRGSIA